MTHRIGLLCLFGMLLLGGCSKDEITPGPQQGSHDDAPAIVSPTSYFIINEDIFGRQNGTVNRLWFDGHITYRAYRKANTGAELGITTQFATIYGENIYFVSKQGERFVVADATTLEKKASFSSIGDGDGRACVGVDARTMYVSTNAGIRIFDIPTLKFTSDISGIEADDALYTGQVGDMVRIGNRVFAAMQGRGVIVIDTQTHSVESVIAPTSTGGVCQSRNGWLWVAGNPLQAYDPYTLEVLRTVELAPEDHGGGVSWGTWRSCSLCASTQHDAIYWLGRDPQAWGDATGILKYDIATKARVPIMKLESYGAIRIDPLTNYITTVDGTLYDDNGTLQREFTLLGGTPDIDGTVDESQPNPYWFSTLPLFEDVNRPAILPNQIVLSQGEVRKICLSDLVIDHDNCSKSMLKEVAFSPSTIVEADIRQDTLHLQGLHPGETSFLLKVCSNGFSTEKQIQLKIQ